MAIAYTSASTALNQKLSVNAKAVEPINEAARTAFWSEDVNSILLRLSNLRNSKDSDQHINRMVKADARQDIKFTQSAT